LRRYIKEWLKNNLIQSLYRKYKARYEISVYFTLPKFKNISLDIVYKIDIFFTIHHCYWKLFKATDCFLRVSLYFNGNQICKEYTKLCRYIWKKWITQPQILIPKLKSLFL